MTAPPTGPVEEDRVAALSAFDDALLRLTDALDDPPGTDLTHRQHEALQRVASSGRRLLGLIDDLLGGSFDLDRSAIAIDEIARSSLMLVEDAAQEKRITTRLRIEGAHATIEADRRRLRQAIVIVLRNAVRFTPAGGSIGIDVTVESGGRVIRFTVWDTGKGLRDRDLTRVFRPRGALYEVGTGLAIVREIVALHGGGIEIDTEPGHGSRVSIIVPTGVPDEAPEALDEGPRASGRAPLRVRKALIATADEAAIAMLTANLRAARFEVVTARTAEEAIDRTWEHEPSMMLIDAQWKRTDVREVMSTLRAAPMAQIASMPIVAFTEISLPGDREKCLAAGADAFLVGPVIMERLEGMLETLGAKSG